MSKRVFGCKKSATCKERITHIDFKAIEAEPWRPVSWPRYAPLTPFGEVEGEIHSYLMTETDKFVVKEGKTDYKILIADKARENVFIENAVADLQLFFKEATGIELEVVEDSSYKDGDKYLAIHETKLATAQSVGATRETLGMGGYRIKTVGESVVMCGATAESSMYAVYSFLKLALGFELYYTDFYALEKGVKDLKLMDYDVTDVPDFEWRIQSTGWIRYNESNRKRMRWTEDRSWIIPVDGLPWHNSLAYLPPEKYQAENPEYFAYPKGTQLCYTARGDDKKRNEMLDIVAGRIVELFSMEEYKNRRHISVSIQDNQDACQCKTCLADRKKYGVVSASIVKFCNDVAKRVSAWMETDEGKPYARDFRILFFAYHATNAAPVKYNKRKDTYLPIDGLVCDPHVAVYFAETNGDYTANLHDGNTANTVIGKNMRGWGALSNEIYFWSYSTNFAHFLTPYYSIDAVQDTLKFAKNEKTNYVMIQDQWIQEGTPTGFGVFKNWLHAKLEWDVNADVKALTDEFFNGYFMEGANAMRQAYEDWRDWAKYQSSELGYNGWRSVYANALQQKFWPKDRVEKWLALTEQAKQDVEIHKAENPTLYKQLCEHISYESIAFRYLLISLYADEYTEEQLLALKTQCAKDLRTSGMSLAATVPLTKVEDLLSKWQIKN